MKSTILFARSKQLGSSLQVQYFSLCSLLGSWVLGLAWVLGAKKVKKKIEAKVFLDGRNTHIRTYTIHID